jgi:hypothetical protein
MTVFRIQRKGTMWEEVIIEAESMEEAMTQAKNDLGEMSWALHHDTWELTGDYWGLNEDTMEEIEA